MRLAKTKFLRFWLIVLTSSLLLAAPVAFAQDRKGSGGINPPIDNPINPNVFPLLDPSLQAPNNLEDLIEPPTAEDPNSPEEKVLDQEDQKSLETVGVEQKWLDEHEGDIQEIQQMRITLLDQAEAKDREKLLHPLDKKGRPVETTDDEIGADGFILKHSGFGRMKLTMCDGRRIAKFFYANKSEALIIFKKGEVDPESKHLNRIRTGLSVLGNPDKGEKEGGYDVVSVVEMNLDNDLIHGATKFNKASFIEDPERWWKDHWDAVYSKPGVNEWAQASVTGGVAQTSVVSGLSHLAMKLHVPGAETTGWFPYVFTFGYATALGAYNESYFNYAYKGKAQSVKQLPVSLAFAAVMLAHSGHMNQSFTFWVLAVATSLAKKPFSSIPWSLISKARMDLRENAGKLRIGTYTTPWNQARVERNLMYLIPFMFVNADVFLRPWMIEHHFVYHDITFPISLVAGAVIARIVNTLYIYSLVRRPVSNDWSPEKVEVVNGLWDKEKTYWKRIGAFWNWPTEIANGAVSTKESTIGTYNNVIETTPKVYKAVVENAPKVYEGIKLSGPVSDFKYSFRGIPNTYNAITENPAMAEAGNALLNTCHMALENLGLKKRPLGSK